MVSHGAHDSLLLEWTGGPENATKWQYRQRPWEYLRPQTWEAWTDIPDSDTAKRSYRVRGLSAYHAYDFEVRAVEGTHPATASKTVTGITQLQGELPAIYPEQIVQGGGSTEWYVADFVITIPDGVRLVGGRPFIAECLPDVTPCGDGTSLRDLASGSVVWFTIAGEEIDRKVAEDSAHDVDALFDQLVASIRNPRLDDLRAQMDGLVPSLRRIPPDEEPGPGASDAQTPLVPDLVVVSDGSHDTLLLEWTGGPENATKWQYRQRRWEDLQPLDWGPWEDIPNSGPATRSYRVAGLRARTAYDYQIRAVVRTAEAGPSPISHTGSTHEQDGLPRLRQGQIVEGDGVAEWRLGNLAITIPEGMRLVADTPWLTPDGRIWMPASDPEGRFGFQFITDGNAAMWLPASEVSGDLYTLLDQVRASARVLE